MPTVDCSSSTNRLSLGETLTASGVGGFVGGFVCFPFEGLKKRFQSGSLTGRDVKELSTGKLKAALHPRRLYEGSVAFASSVMVSSLTSITFKSTLMSLPGYDRSSRVHDFCLSVTSGMLGAIVGSTPVENLILAQQMKKCGPVQGIKHLFAQGAFRPWVGVNELMLREAVFATVMLSGAPFAHKRVFEKTKSEVLANVASIGVGITGAVLSTPPDVVATIRQKADGKVSLTNTISTLYESQGMGGFFRGVGPRAVLFTGCALLVPYFTDLFARKVLDRPVYES